MTLIAQTLTYIGSENRSLLSWLIVTTVFVIAVCLLVGFMTPIVAIAIGLASAGFAIFTFENIQPAITVIVLTTVIALLGPGAFSIDARMFGRREILIPHTPRLPKP